MWQCIPSVSLARPPVGVQRIAEQLLHCTTVWELLNTVVLQQSNTSVRIQKSKVSSTKTRPLPTNNAVHIHSYIGTPMMASLHANISKVNIYTLRATVTSIWSMRAEGRNKHSSGGGARQLHPKDTHIWKQPWHLTSMKKEFGDWTNLLSLCFCFCSSAGGCNRSISYESVCEKTGR